MIRHLPLLPQKANFKELQLALTSEIAQLRSSETSPPASSSLPAKSSGAAVVPPETGSQE
ncbi:hypothetical protein AK812_SmicGene46453, partial [Symbiodinium microadriaticum]